MQHATIKHTINLFRQYVNHLPPLLPEEIKKEAQHALEHLENDYTISPVEVENVVIALGKKIWPFWKAFQEFLVIYQGKLGEKFLLGKLSPSLKRRYEEFKQHGATYHDLRLGGPINFFEAEERSVLISYLLEIDMEIRHHTEQAVLTTDRKKYEALVVDFQNIFDDIEKRLGHLRIMVEDEEEHPQVAEEIRSQVRAFEFGLCLLEPHRYPQELNNIEDYIEERKQTKRLYQG